MGYGFQIDVYDPMASTNDVEKVYNISKIEKLDKTYDVIVHAVAHNEFLDLDYKSLRKTNSILYDLKGNLPKDITTKRL